MQRIAFHLANMKQVLMKINLFRKESSYSQMVNTEQIALIATRLYVILLTASISILVLLHGLNQTTMSITISSPTVNTFEQLQATYPSTFSCQCQQISVTYGSFVSMIPSYHQVSL